MEEQQDQLVEATSCKEDKNPGELDIHDGFPSLAHKNDDDMTSEPNASQPLQLIAESFSPPRANNEEEPDHGENQGIPAARDGGMSLHGAPKARQIILHEQEREQKSNAELNQKPIPKTHQPIVLSITGILSLPIDSLHYVASFLTPFEWCEFGVVSNGAHRVCHEVIRRVRMHGFKCATEIITAWKLGQLEDAKELAALYISSGVPVYPRCLGHSYHTLVWKMTVEDREARSADAQNSTTSREADLFFQTRALSRTRDEYIPNWTYVEEKCFFWAEHDPTKLSTPRPVSRNYAVRNGVLSAPSSNGKSHNTVLDSHGSVGAKVPMPIHQHLLDQHRLRRPAVDDLEGAMVTPLVSLSADFYHPASGSVLKNNITSIEPVERATTLPVALDDVRQAEHDGALAESDDDGQPLLRSGVISLQNMASIVNGFQMEVYSAANLSTLNIPSIEQSQELRKHLRSRFGAYQRRLENFIAQGDLAEFEESMLDLWDEFFPYTATVQYHDRQTAVPRISCLQKFLTRPCPKAIGTVQCEIERIKLSTKGKGVNVKGRFFPTYEYRLFIRNLAHGSVLPESPNAEPDNFVRRDTVIMVAKNRGRRHADLSGVVPISPAARKGSNNYCLYMPNQSDVDAHFNEVNACAQPVTFVPNGASHKPVVVSEDSGISLLGRLQSNFVGTEFQIYTSRLKKKCRGKVEGSANILSPSDDGMEYESGCSTDNNSSWRHRFGRLSLRRSSTKSNTELPAMAMMSPINRSPLPVKRSLSCPDMAPTRQTRTNRRAIANTPDSFEQQLVWCEEEDGIITYTANLLGSRPRIMDVCIPKVDANGVAGVEWRRHLESCEDVDDCKMLNWFKQLLQQIDEHETQAAHPDTDSDNGTHGNTTDDFGLMALQNRPPWWNIELGSYVLNFGGRVSVASVKNFQLCDRNDHDRILLQFGRITGRHSFTMDFQHPLTAVQAFSIAISSLQSKISFG